MSKEVRLRSGTATEHASFTGAPAEVTVDTTNNRLRVHDGLTAGGHPLAKSSEIDGKLDKIGGTVSGVLTLENTLDFGDSMIITRNIGNGNRGFHIAPSAYMDYDTAENDLRLVNNAIQGLIIKDNGIVQKPAAPAFQAFHSGTIAETVPHVVEFSNVHLNQGNHYNPTNSRFTAPETGLYWFEAHIFYGLPQVTSGGHWQFRVNGVAAGSAFHATSASTPIGHLIVSGSTCRHLNQGDYVDIHLHLHTNATLWPHAYSGFGGFLIG